MLQKKGVIALKRLTSILILSLFFLISGCGIFGSDDDGNPLAGEVSFTIEGEPGTTAFMAHSYSEGLEFFGETLGTIEIPSSGVYSQDLESGDFDAYQVSATVADPDVTITLRLKSNGDVLDETSEREEEGFFIAQYGEFPDFDFE